MADPNRIFERVEKLVCLARSALEEAEGIIKNAEADNEDPEVIKSARELLENL